MPKFLIERDIPGAGDLTPEQLAAASQNSCNVLRVLGPDVQWVHSYVTQDRITCIYLAPHAAAVMKHAELAGLPANAVREVRTIIDPTTADMAVGV